MARYSGSCTRRSLLVAALAARRVHAQSAKGVVFPADAERYPDPLTELAVNRLTTPEYATSMTAYFNRGIARNSAWMLCSCDRPGSPQAFHLDLKSGGMKLLTEATGLLPASLSLTPDNHSFCYIAAGSLWLCALGNLRARELYQAGEGWELDGGMSVGPDGTHATLVERRGPASRIRKVPLRGGDARTVIEIPVLASNPIHRPMRAQILYRHAPDALSLVNSDGSQNRKLKIAPGGVGAPNWSPDGKTILYLNFPEDRRQLFNLREFNPDTGADKMIAKTSQYASFGANRDASVFVGASSNSSPDVLLLVRSSRSERTMCEHKASDPAAVAPLFSPDSQRIYFQSDRHGKSAIYSMDVERLVEKTGAG